MGKASKDIILQIVNGFIDNYTDDTREMICNDKILQQYEYKRCWSDMTHFLQQWFWIVDKNLKTVRLILNDTQNKYLKNRTRRDIILKARKQGISTLKCAEYFYETCFRENSRSTVLAHDLRTAGELLSKIHFAYDHLPVFLRPIVGESGRKNRTGLSFTSRPDGSPLNTTYNIGTAGNKELGRGWDIDNLHLSEYAFYDAPEAIIKGAMEAMRIGGNVSIESTANGFNDFHRIWEEAQSGYGQFKPHFFAWFDDPTDMVEHVSPKELEELTPLELETQKTYKLTDNQIVWYHQKARDLRESVRQEFPDTPESAFIASGSPVFDVDKLQLLKKKAEAVTPVAVEESGQLVIWRKFDPAENKRYIIGADTSQGVPGGDFSHAVVIDNETYEDVAALHGRWTPNVFAKKLGALGLRYGNALIAVERNNHGHSVLNTLTNVLYYGNLFYYRDYDASAGRPQVGFHVNVKSKPQIIDLLANIIIDGSTKINDPHFCAEAMTYVYTNAAGKTGAQVGTHDDRVMARAIAMRVAELNPYTVPVEKPEPSKQEMMVAQLKRRGMEGVYERFPRYYDADEFGEDILEPIGGLAE